MKENFFKKTSVVWALALVCCALWGSAFPAVKIGYEMFSVDTSDPASLILFAGSRFIIAGLLAIIIGSVSQKKILVPKKHAWPMVFKLSIFQTIGQYVLFYIALAHSTGVRASILNGLNVFIAIVVACVLFRQEKLTTNKIVGTVIGFAGLVVVCLNGSSLELGFTLLGDGFMILSAVSYAFSSVFLKRYSQYENPVMLSGYQFFVGGLVMAIAGAAAGGHIVPVSGASFLLLFYMGCISAVAYSLWGILLKNNDVSRVTVFGFMNQIFGVSFSAIFLSEGAVINIYIIIALALVCTGIIIVNRKPKAA
ncbi:MAG TPA: DMT family transporter [Candidatus Alectryocaccobium stercorigallinarum]|jgi:drug/metabolite transporter (DMT)-like permease|nr:DMT family transporter [Candidatus Alectryocaccobium stercorigallinarum]